MRGNITTDAKDIKRIIEYYKRLYDIIYECKNFLKVTKYPTYSRRNLNPPIAI